MAYKIDEVVDFDSLVCVAHQMAVDKGWWEGERPLCRLRLLIASEIAEAVECLRDGKIDTWYQESGKPEGFWVELADALVRIADATGAGVMECGCVDGFDHAIDDEIDLWASLDSILFDVTHDELGHGVRSTLALAASNNHDLWATIREKLAYNATRPHKHGRGA